jgi:predicted NUDIX family NTP pyrophosphohydrolase
MPKLSAGLLPYRWRDDAVEVLLVHPGGPYWAKRDDDPAWPSYCEHSFVTWRAPLRGVA